MGVFQNYSRQTFGEGCLQQIKQEYSFYDYVGLYYLAYMVFILCKSVEAISSFDFFYGFIAVKISDELLSISITVAIQLFLELLIIGNLYLFLKRTYSLAPVRVWVLLLVGLAFSGLLMYASVMGTGEIMQDKQIEKSTASKYDSLVNVKKSEISEIQKRNTWQNNTYIAGEEKELLHAKEAEMRQLAEEKKNRIKTIAKENETTATTARYWMAGFEALSLIALWFTFYFRYRVGVEAGVADGEIKIFEPQKVEQAKSKIILPMNYENNTAQKPIGFSQNIEKTKKHSHLYFKHKHLIEAIRNGLMTNEAMAQTFNVHVNTVHNMKKMLRKDGYNIEKN